MIGYGIILFIVGCYQIISTLFALFSIRRLSRKIRRHLICYGCIVGLFFLVQQILMRSDSESLNDFYVDWLFFAPVPIAAYRLLFGLKMWQEILKST